MERRDRRRRTSDFVDPRGILKPGERVDPREAEVRARMSGLARVARPGERVDPKKAAALRRVR